MLIGSVGNPHGAPSIGGDCTYRLLALVDGLPTVLISLEYLLIILPAPALTAGASTEEKAAGRFL